MKRTNEYKERILITVISEMNLKFRQPIKKIKYN